MPAEVEVFTGPNCSHCESAKALLTEHGVTFVERHVDDPAELDELRRRAPRAMALPQIFLDGDHIGNDDDLRIRREQHRPPFDTAHDTTAEAGR